MFVATDGFMIQSSIFKFCSFVESSDSFSHLHSVARGNSQRNSASVLSFRVWLCQGIGEFLYQLIGDICLWRLCRITLLAGLSSQ